MLVVVILTLGVLAGCTTSGIHQAVKKGDIAALQKQIEAGADINESDSRWGTPLAYASWLCKPEVARYLVQQGADLKASGGSINGDRPLHWAIYAGCIEIVRILVDAGADINVKPDAACGPPLYHAIIGHHDDIAKYLVARGANLESAITLSEPCRGSAEVIPVLEKYRREVMVEAARKALEQKKEKEKALIQEIENANLIGLLNMRPETGLQIEALTQALIRAKNTQLPGFIVRSSVEERVNLLTTVELRINDAQTLISRLNALAEDAVRQGQSAAAFREEAGKVQTYASILSAIRSLLLQS